MKIQKEKAKVVKVGDDKPSKHSGVKLKKLKIAHARPSEDDDDDESVLVQSRPKTASDQRRVLGVNPEEEKRNRFVKNAKARLAADTDDDEEMDDEERIKYLEAELARLKQYKGVKLTPKNVGKAGRREGGFRRASVPGISEEGDLVKVVMLKTLDPAPVIGKCNIVQDHGHERLEKGETYQLPENAAKHLAETRALAIVD